MLTMPRLTGLVREIAQHGLLFGSTSPYVDVTGGQEPGTVAEALPAVRQYIREPLFPDGTGFPESGPGDIALAIVAGARRALADVQAIERAAAEVAREHGVTVRQLAAAAGISERAGNDRYRRTGIAAAGTVRGEGHQGAP